MLRRRRKPLYLGVDFTMFSFKAKLLIALTMAVLLALAVIIPTGKYLKKLSAEMAISDATDLITLAINNSIHELMSEGQYDYDYFVTLEKNSSGDISAIKTNMARINTLSSSLLNNVVNSADNGVLEINIPLGNLFGSNLMLGRGPNIPVKIVMLTSSFADFRNDLSSAGINQTRHQIILEVMVDIDILIPWETVSARVVSEIIVAETIIVGSVPDTYLGLEQVK